MRKPYHLHLLCFSALLAGLATAAAQPYSLEAIEVEPTASDLDIEASPTFYRHTTDFLKQDVATMRTQMAIQPAEKAEQPFRRVLERMRHGEEVGTGLIFEHCERPEGMLEALQLRRQREAAPVVQRQAGPAAAMEPEKPYISVSLSATVYDNRFTRLRLWHEGEEHIFWSNVDFNLLRGVTQIETDNAHFGIYMGIGDESVRRTIRYRRAMLAEGFSVGELPEIPWVPMGRFFNTEAPRFLAVDADNRPLRRQAHPAVRRFVRLLHNYYEENEVELQEEWIRRTAIRRAMREYREQNPPEPRDTVVRFFPVQGGVHSEQ